MKPTIHVANLWRQILRQQTPFPHTVPRTVSGNSEHGTSYFDKKVPHMFPGHVPLSCTQKKVLSLACLSVCAQMCPVCPICPVERLTPSSLASPPPCRPQPSVQIRRRTINHMLMTRRSKQKGPRNGSGRTAEARGHGTSMAEVMAREAVRVAADFVLITNWGVRM